MNEKPLLPRFMAVFKDVSLNAASGLKYPKGSNATALKGHFFVDLNCEFLLLNVVLCRGSNF